MYKAIILAGLFAISNAASAADSVAVKEPQCPAGTKLVRGAEITIAEDGSGVLVDRSTCEPQELPADAAKDSVKAK
jgi:hypothetical protein